MPANLKRRVRDIRYRERNRARAFLRYHRIKDTPAHRERISRRKLTPEQTARYNENRRAKAERLRATIVELDSSSTLAAELREGGLSPQSKLQLQIDTTYWIGPGMRRENQLDQLATQILDAIDKGQPMSADKIETRIRAITHEDVTA